MHIFTPTRIHVPNYAPFLHHSESPMLNYLLFSHVGTIMNQEVHWCKINNLGFSWCGPFHCGPQSAPVILAQDGFEFSGQNVTYMGNLWERKTSLEEIFLRGSWWGHKWYASPFREAWPPLNADEVSHVGSKLGAAQALLDILAGKRFGLGSAFQGWAPYSKPEPWQKVGHICRQTCNVQPALLVGSTQRCFLWQLVPLRTLTVGSWNRWLRQSSYTDIKWGASESLQMGVG